MPPYHQSPRLSYTASSASSDAPPPFRLAGTSLDSLDSMDSDTSPAERPQLLHASGSPQHSMISQPDTGKGTAPEQGRRSSIGMSDVSRNSLGSLSSSSSASSLNNPDNADNYMTP